MKSESFYFNKIEGYFSGSKKSDVYQTISDRTFRDLDLDEIFMFLDRTISKVGQQYYYHIFRTIPVGNSRRDKTEQLIKVLEENSDTKEKVLVQLSRLSKEEAYYITELFEEKYIQKPAWFWVVQFLSVISISLVLLSFFYPQLILILIGILSVNYLVHYWNKQNLHKYAASITQLLVLNQVSKELLKLNIIIDNPNLFSCTKAIDSVGRRMSIFKLGSTFPSDLDSLFEVVRALFLVEPLILFNVLGKLNTRKDQIHQLYTYIGEVDVAISISSLRKNIPYYTQARHSKLEKFMYAEDMYHPLLTNAVANSIELSGKSALLTGSNMSGKTTFIRTVGINVILSQTINTCFARSFVSSKLKVHSAIRISDDLISEKSYYFEEVVTIKKMLEESSDDKPSLFLLDEIFKGTNTIERIAAGKSVLSYLNRNNNIVLVSTHDIELADLLKGIYNLHHFTELVENEKIVFDYKLKTGNLQSTNAIRILEINNYPAEVTDEAKKLSIQIRKNNVTNKA